MNKAILTLILFQALLVMPTNAQNIQYAQSLIDTLASPYFHGRGYVNDGDRKAAQFIRSEMNRIGLEAINGQQSHAFSLNVNTFPKSMKIEVRGEQLIAGRDFVVNPACPSVKTTSAMFYISESDLANNKTYQKLLRKKCNKTVVVLDTVSDDKTVKERRQHFIDQFEGLCLINIKKDLTWSVSREQAASPVIWMLPGKINNAPFIDIDIDAEFIQGYKTKNVLGMIKGTEHPDSFIVITGHYDHLGRMGSEVYMPGANDNASGIAMILDLASYFRINPPRYSILFIAFAAEEAGLVGSYHFVQQMDDYISQRKIRFLINMDLMGSGEEGIMAVNGLVFTEEFDALKGINDSLNYLTVVKARGKAANSDHYFFTEAGVRGFFFYLMGAYAHYHEVDDAAQNLRLDETSYNNSFLLIRDFARRLMGS